MSSGREGCHVESFQNRRPAASGAALSAVFTAVSIKWSHAREFGDFLTVRLAELWKFSHENVSGCFPDSRNGAQKLLFLPPERAILDRFLNLAFSLCETLF